MFDLDADFEADDIARRDPGTPRRRSHKPRFLPYQVKAEVYT